MPSLVSCACGKRIYRGATSAANPRCRECQRAETKHGDAAMYKRGCRCADCTTANTEQARLYVRAVKARDGLTPTEKVKPSRWKRCADCGERIRGRAVSYYCQDCGSKRRGRMRPSSWISKDRRLAIYDRDGWTCQICSEPVDPTAPPGSRWYPSLDHIEPLALVLIPDNSDRNLRCAHRSCNSSRGARVA